MLISVANINAARKFYEDLFGLEVFQDYGRNIAFTCGLALQQDFDWFMNLPKEKVLKKSNNTEIVFEEQDFDTFLNKLKQYPDIEYLGEVIEHNWGQRVIRFPQFFYVLRTSRYYLEDLYVKPECRGKGYGKAILKKLASIAVERGCGRLEWWCPDWNKPSIDFYLSLGAEAMSDWAVYRIAGDTLTQLAE